VMQKTAANFIRLEPGSEMGVAMRLCIIRSRHRRSLHPWDGVRRSSRRSSACAVVHISSSRSCVDERRAIVDLRAGMSTDHATHGRRFGTRSAAAPHVCTCSRRSP